jgi:hypothetical protein
MNSPIRAKVKVQIIPLILMLTAFGLFGCDSGDDLKAAAPATSQERAIVERAFCSAVNDDPNRDVAGIEPAVADQVERAGVQHVRASFIIAQWFSDLSDHKIATACGKALAGYQG